MRSVRLLLATLAMLLLASPAVADDCYPIPAGGCVDAPQVELPVYEPPPATESAEQLPTTGANDVALAVAISLGMIGIGVFVWKLGE